MKTWKSIARRYGLLLHQREIGLVLVFVNTKNAATELERFLAKMNIRTVSIHGDKDQRQREAALADFKSKRCPVMIATDVAARGLDIPDVALVVQYDCAQSSDDFVHRIGRTGRIKEENNPFILGRCLWNWESCKTSGSPCRSV